MRYRIGNSVIKVVSGDICQSKCEAIVSSDDNWLSQGGGVSYAISIAGGKAIRKQINRLAPVDLGDVAVTTAGELSQKYIFHAVTIDWDQSRPRNGELYDFIVKNSVRRCFQLMSALKLSSIAFPVIGTGVAGIPVERAVRGMAEVFAEELGKTNRGLSVELWVFGMASDFADALLEDIVNSRSKSRGLFSTNLIDVSPSTADPVRIATSENAESGKSALSSMSTSEGSGDGIAPGEISAGRVLQGQSGRGEGKLIVQEDNSTCPADGTAREVFISYSRNDSLQADWICEVLKSAGISYWRDVDGLYSGFNFKGVIVRAIRAAHTVFFLSSANSNASANVVGEIGAAVHFGKHVVPIRLDATEYHDDLLLDLLNLDNIDLKVLGQEKAAEKIRKVVFLNRANSQVNERSKKGGMPGYAI